MLGNKEKEKSIEDCVERDTAVAQMRVHDGETAITQEQVVASTAENVWVTTRQPAEMFEAMLNAFGHWLRDLASSDNEQNPEHREDDQRDTELGKLSDHDKPGWVMGTCSKLVQHRMESFRQKQMRSDELTHPGWGDAVNYIHGREMKYGTAELNVPAVVKPQIVMTAATPSSGTSG